MIKGTNLSRFSIRSTSAASIILLIGLVVTIACGGGEPTSAPTENVEATVSVAVVASRATEPTEVPAETRLPTDTPEPPTTTSLPPFEDGSLRITILYDNTTYDDGLSADWGFAALIEFGGQNLLFDAGQKGDVLLENIKRLELDPDSIDAIMISHFHSDHVAGLSGLPLAQMSPKVYVLPSFSNRLVAEFNEVKDVVEVTPGQAVGQGMFTTGEMPGGPLPEQALVIETQDELVVVTGCSHPGIVEIVERTKELFGGPVHLVVGGFHLLEHSETAIRSILGDLHRLGVRQVSPTHCTGERAIALFAEEYGDDYVQAGAGRIIVAEP